MRRQARKTNSLLPPSSRSIESTRVFQDLDGRMKTFRLSAVRGWNAVEGKPVPLRRHRVVSRKPHRPSPEMGWLSIGPGIRPAVTNASNDCAISMAKAAEEASRSSSLLFARSATSLPTSATVRIECAARPVSSGCPLAPPRGQIRGVRPSARLPRPPRRRRDRGLQPSANPAARSRCGGRAPERERRRGCRFAK